MYTWKNTLVCYGMTVLGTKIEWSEMSKTHHINLMNIIMCGPFLASIAYGINIKKLQSSSKQKQFTDIEEIILESY